MVVDMEEIEEAEETGTAPTLSYLHQTVNR